MQVEKHCIPVAEWPGNLRTCMQFRIGWWLTTGAFFAAWLAATNAHQNWTHTGTHLVYRQLAPGNPLGLLVGGLPEFVAYARDWYGVDATELDRQQLTDAFVAANVARSTASAATPPPHVGTVCSSTYMYVDNVFCLVYRMPRQRLRCKYA
jgi:hypothetical protein